MSVISSNRFKSIDALRGIAAIAVVLYHLVFAFHVEYGYSSYPMLDFKYGFFGVELFFIISGYVIYYTINQSKNVKEFLIKRFIRLYPTYWLCMLLTFCIVYFFPLSELRNSSFRELFWGFSMLQGLFGVKSVDPSYWSLLIELIFYFGIALISFFKLLNKIVVILIGWLMIIIVYNYIYKIPFLGALLNLRYGALFIAGICFYKIKMEENQTIELKLILVFSFIVSILNLRDMEGAAIAISAVFLIFFVAVFIVPKLFEFPWLLFLGNVSYPLYLIHQNIGFVILKELKKTGINKPIVVIIPLAVSIFLAWVITRFYERNVTTRLKSLFFR